MRRQMRSPVVLHAHTKLACFNACPSRIWERSRKLLFGRLRVRYGLLKRELDTSELTSHAFVLPALVQCSGSDLAARAGSWRERVSRTEGDIAEIQLQIDGHCFDCYGFHPEDRRMTGEAGSAERSRSDFGGEREIRWGGRRIKSGGRRASSPRRSLLRLAGWCGVRPLRPAVRDWRACGAA